MSAPINEPLIRWAFEQRTGGLNQKLVLVVLCAYADAQRCIVISEQELGRICEINGKRSLRIALNLLAKHGFIDRVGNMVRIRDPGVRVPRGADRLSISKTIRHRINKRDGWRCISCGSQDDLTVDHIIPQSRGGCHDDANLQTLCAACNCAKGDRTQEEWNSDRGLSQ